MKRLSFLLTLITLITLTSWAQKNPVADVTNLVTIPEVEAHLTFLAADEMRGRDTGSPELDIAANYIASYFKQQGIKTVPGAEKYFQNVELQTIKSPRELELTVNGQKYKLKEDLVLMAGDSARLEGDVVFAGYGSKEDMEKVGVKDKIVVTFAGNSSENNIMKAFVYDGPAKLKTAKDLGAKALVEILALPGIPWMNIADYFTRERTSLKKEASIPHVWMRNSDDAIITSLKETKRGTGALLVRGISNKTISSKNVIGLVEGTDPKLKGEYVVVSAHYDHVGVNPAMKPDSIFNGARDNAIGTVGLMATAKYLAKFPPKRSVLLMALTGEEKGLLGSAYYVQNPLIPLNKTVFNFNCDGAGYNDTTMVTVIGLERTTVRDDLDKAGKAFALKVEPDPVPEQNLYERSDNFNFAAKGIPAIDFAPGTKGFDPELMKYYHQPADEVSTLDFNYLVKYFRAYVYANHLIANRAATPVWTAGDKFEPESKKLYSR